MLGATGSIRLLLLLGGVNLWISFSGKAVMRMETMLCTLVIAISSSPLASA
jgi:hypothetical protein